MSWYNQKGKDVGECQVIKGQIEIITPEVIQIKIGQVLDIEGEKYQIKRLGNASKPMLKKIK